METLQNLNILTSANYPSLRRDCVKTSTINDRLYEIVIEYTGIIEYILDKHWTNAEKLSKHMGIDTNICKFAFSERCESTLLL